MSHTSELVLPAAGQPPAEQSPHTIASLRSKRRRTSIRIIALGSAFPVLVLAIWQLAGYLGWIDIPTWGDVTLEIIGTKGVLNIDAVLEEAGHRMGQGS